MDFELKGFSKNFKRTKTRRVCALTQAVAGPNTKLWMKSEMRQAVFEKMTFSWAQRTTPINTINDSPFHSVTTGLAFAEVLITTGAIHLLVVWKV